jgi:NDP-sugar pyrophosphorylase family protein
MQAVVLAGGLGTRLGELGAATPKTLMEVGGRPFADHQLAWLGAEGVDEAVYCLGHLGAQVRDFVGDGSRWGLRVAYVEDGETLAGTAGALRRALDAGVLAPRFFVVYGDSHLTVSLADMDAAFAASGLDAMMAVFRNDGRYDTSNVVFEDGRLVRYDKARPREWADRMHHIDYGVSVLDRSVIADRVAPGAVADLAGVLRDLSVAGRLGGFEVHHRFYEIGTPASLAELDELLTTGTAPRTDEATRR